MDPLQEENLEFKKTNSLDISELFPIEVKSPPRKKQKIEPYAYKDLLKTQRYKDALVPEDLEIREVNGILYAQGREVITKTRWYALKEKCNKNFYFSDTCQRLTRVQVLEMLKNQSGKKNELNHFNERAVITNDALLKRHFKFVNGTQRVLNRSEKKLLEFNEEEQKLYYNTEEVIRFELPKKYQSTQDLQETQLIRPKVTLTLHGMFSTEKIKQISHQLDVINNICETPSPLSKKKSPHRFFSESPLTSSDLEQIFEEYEERPHSETDDSPSDLLRLFNSSPKPQG